MVTLTPITGVDKENANIKTSDRSILFWKAGVLVNSFPQF